MSLPTILPTREEIIKDLYGWKSYIASLNNVVNEVVTFLSLDEESKNNVSIMKYMFEIYVSPKYPHKQFNSFMVIGSRSVKKGHKIKYNHQGVIMNYHGRMTSSNDDYDYFIDRIITVDEQVILKEEA
jgi:hypothetical protein